MKEKLKNKKIVYIIIGIVAVLLVAVAITYAYWLITKNQTGENVISSACLDISLTDEENDITLTNQFPLSDEDGAKLTPYTFTVTNNCNTSVDYHINLEAIGTESEAVISSAIKAMLDKNTPQILSDYSEKDITVEGAYEAHLLGSGTLSAKDTDGSSTTHSLRLWIDADAPISEMNKTFRSKISVTIGQGIEATQGSSLASLILADAQTNNYLYSTTPDFSKVTEDGEYGLYQAQDDYGTSYYFRGDVENNYVQFGKWQEDNIIYLGGDSHNFSYSSYEACMNDVEAGAPFSSCAEYQFGNKGNDMYWRIVRINGDGTIRIVYDGTSTLDNGNQHISIIGWTSYDQYSNGTSVGYTNDDGKGNQIDSTIKSVVDTWYNNNLEQEYGQYIADSVFCNDKYIISTEEYEIYYGSFNRLHTNKSPVLTCTNQSDRYTVNDTQIGNGLLTKPIGLITADEIAMAGGLRNIANRTNYLYSSSQYWTSSLSHYDGVGGSLYQYVDDAGTLTVNSPNVGSETFYGVRPVINLKADVLFEGNGKIDDPYKIITE